VENLRNNWEVRADDEQALKRPLEDFYQGVTDDWKITVCQNQEQLSQYLSNHYINESPSEKLGEGRDKTQTERHTVENQEDTNQSLCGWKDEGQEDQARQNTKKSQPGDDSMGRPEISGAQDTVEQPESMNQEQVSAKGQPETQATVTIQDATRGEVETRGRRSLREPRQQPTRAIEDMPEEMGDDDHIDNLDNRSQCGSDMHGIQSSLNHSSDGHRSGKSTAGKIHSDSGGRGLRREHIDLSPTRHESADLSDEKRERVPMEAATEETATGMLKMLGWQMKETLAEMMENGFHPQPPE
jgi:hypothetical protein